LTSNRSAATTQTTTVTSQAILAAGTRAILAAVAAQALTPELALEYLDQLSTDIRASIVLGADGTMAAASAPGADGERLSELARELFERADAADSEPVSQVEVTTGDGAVYAARDDKHAIAVVTGRFALASLMFFDLRKVLEDLGKAA
jgi:predicted regulator of Ras-like GTPase activity (Roadblock/LC7/MglB family)